MRQFLFILAILGTAVFASCDFPSDPPLLPDDSGQPPDMTPDSTDVLLPLKSGNAWLYVAIPRMRPIQDPRYAMATPIMDDTVKYHEVPYVYSGTPQLPRTLAFPPVLRNTRAGLEFYDKINEEDTLRFTHSPEHRFTLPYPARRGTTWKSASGEVSVVLVSADTLVEDLNNVFSWRTYRYDVSVRNQLTTSFYIIPGTAIIRVETRNILFETISWRLF
jgi:hypothetical protein